MLELNCERGCAHLYLCNKVVTDYNRQTVIQKPSRFITEVPPELYDIWTLEEEEGATITLPENGEQKYIN